MQSVADAREAALGGADRLEIVREISIGGLTPPLSLVRAIAGETSLPLRVMLRENAGYATTPEESSRLQADAADIVEAGVDGLVVGFATNAGTPALDDLRRILSAVPGARATFHRAFDALVDPLGAIDAIRNTPEIDRILTSGGAGTQRCAVRGFARSPTVRAHACHHRRRRRHRGDAARYRGRSLRDGGPRRPRRARRCQSRESGPRRIGPSTERPPGPPTDGLLTALRPPTFLSEYLRHHLAVDVGQPEVASLEAVRQLLVVDAERVQDGGLEVVDRDRVGHHVVAELVGLAEHEPALHAAAGDPHAEVPRMMVAAVVRVGQLALAEHRPAELAAPDDERVVEQAALLQVGDQRGGRLIGAAALQRHDRAADLCAGPIRDDRAG